MSTDNTILKLKAEIEKKKEALKLSERFTPITNCSLELDGKRHNLHVLDKHNLTYLLIILNVYYKSAKDLGVLEDFVLAGFPVIDWITDIKAKLAHVNRNETAKNLKAMENRLTQLLSDEKKVELEVAEISKLLSA